MYGVPRLPSLTKTEKASGDINWAPSLYAAPGPTDSSSRLLEAFLTHRAAPSGFVAAMPGPISPSGAAARCSAKPAMALRKTASLSTNTVLLVDDVQLNRAILGRMLSKMGFEVQEACDGQQAVELFQTCLPACVLLDLQMPIMDGWETAEQLRLWEDQQQLARTPIVGCTALPLQEQWGDSATVEASALSSGFDEMLGKMPTMAQLLAVLSKHLAGLPSAAAGGTPSVTAVVSAAAATDAAASAATGSKAPARA